MWKELIFFNQYQFSLLCLKKSKSNNTIISLRKTSNGNVHVICYYSKDIVPPYLCSISQNYYNTLSRLHIPTVEHDIRMDEKQREIIELERSFSIRTQDTIYYYNEEFWDLIYIKRWFPFFHIISSNCQVQFYGITSSPSK